MYLHRAGIVAGAVVVNSAMQIIRFLPFALFALVAACAGQPAEPWAKPDHTPPTAAETSYCHQEARRQAASLYPDQPPNGSVGMPAVSDQRRFPAEVSLYEQCMTRSGFVRVAPPPSH
jgi:hypothetical protein